MLELKVDVVWPSGKVVHVRLRGISNIAVRNKQEEGGAVALQHEDVLSLEGFQKFMRNKTRVVAEGVTLQCFGIESDVATVFELLKLEGPTTSYQLELPREA
jgi:hypothetical protein